MGVGDVSQSGCQLTDREVPQTLDSPPPLRAISSPRAAVKRAETYRYAFRYDLSK